jgi:hypothetical protein
MPFASDWHPEFGYLSPSPGLRRKLRLAVVAAALGLTAGAGGMAVLIAGHDSNPRDASALVSPEEVHAVTTSKSTGDANVAPTASVRQSQPEAINPANNPACREHTWDYFDGNCTPGKGRNKTWTVHVPVERPAIAAIPIGRSEGPAVLSSQPTMPVAAPPDGPDGSARSADAAPAPDAAPTSAVKEVPAPDVAAKTPRKTAHSHQVRHRERNEYSPPPVYGYQYGYPYRRGGYAYQGPWTVWR